MIQTRELANGTGYTYVMPWGLYRNARLLCPDGKVRTTSRIAPTADTFYSVPASVKVRGKTVSGYMSIATVSGSSVETPDDPSIARFVPHSYGVNANAFEKPEIHE